MPRTLEELVAAIAALPPARGRTRSGAKSSAIAALEKELGTKLPNDLKALLRASDGLSIAGGAGFALEDTAGIAALAADPIYDDAFPKMLPIGGDAGQGTYLVALRGASLPAGSVLLTDRGSLSPEQTVLVGGSVLAALEAALAGEDLWKRPRRSAPDPKAAPAPTWDAYVAIELAFSAGGSATWRAGQGRLPDAPWPQLLSAIGDDASTHRVEVCIERLARTFTITSTSEAFGLLGLVRKKGYWKAARDLATIVTASAEHGATGIALILNGGSSVTRDDAVVFRVANGLVAIEGLTEDAARELPERHRLVDAATMASAIRLDEARKKKKPKGAASR